MYHPAACVLLPTGNWEGEILAISRRNDFTQWGIPGGKQDPGESNLKCARREVSEECGLTLEKHLLLPIYSGACHGKDGRHFWVTTYLYQNTFEGTVVPEEGFKVLPMSIDELCSENVSPFFEYNRMVSRAWDEYYP